MTDSKNFNWDAPAFFARLAASNRLAMGLGLRFVRCSSLEGFHDALGQLLSAPGFIAVSDTSQGAMMLGNTPHTRRVKTVFLALRHAVDDMEARQECMQQLREVFRQLMSVLLLERTRLEQQCVYIDSDIAFTEIDRYFFSGCACAFFQIAVDTCTDLVYNPAEWLPE